jgi:CHAD domain-containing protein
VLAVYRKVFDADAVTGLRSGLAELGGVLGEARDLEVRIQQAELVGSSSTSQDEAELVGWIVTDLEERYRLAHDQVTAWCLSPRYAELTELLLRWSTDPPLGDRAARPAVKTARKGLLRQADRTVTAADDLDVARLAAPWSATAAHGLAEAHETRKAARRLAHATSAVTESPTSVLDGPAPALGEQASRLQGVLGAHRDAVMLAAHVAQLATGPERDRGPFHSVVEGADQLARAALGDLVPAVKGLVEAREAFAAS